MQYEKQNPTGGNGRASQNINQLSGAINTNEHSGICSNYQAASYIARQHRVTYPYAKLICELNGIGGLR